MSLCPSDFRLDDLELHGEAPPSEVSAHLATCPACGDRLAARAGLRAEFLASVAPPLWRAIETEIRRPTSRWRWRLGLGIATLAAAAAVAIVARPVERSRTVYTGVKGGFSLELVCRRGDRIFRLEQGEPVAPGDELRFRPWGTPAGGSYILIGSVDGGGRFAPFYPSRSTEESVPAPPTGEALPAAVRIDGAPGPEKILALVSQVPIRAASAAPVAEVAAARLDPVHAIAGVAVTSVWLVVPKVVARSIPIGH
jgi:hypothetical protein